MAAGKALVARLPETLGGGEAMPEHISSMTSAYGKAGAEYDQAHPRSRSGLLAADGATVRRDGFTRRPFAERMSCRRIGHSRGHVRGGVR